MKKSRRMLALFLAVISIMSVMVVTASASSSDSEDTRRVSGATYTYGAARDKDNSTPVYLKITSCADDHLYVRVHGCNANGVVQFNCTMAGTNVDNVVCRTGVNYSIHSSVNEDGCPMAKLSFKRLDPAASYISVGYKWSPDSTGSYTGAT